MRAKVRLRRVARGDFRTSEHTMLMSLQPHERKLRGNDCVCFISGTGNQVVFVYAMKSAGETRATSKYEARPIEIVTSVRLRLTAGSWNPLMLQNYAADAGLELEGLKRFEEHYSNL